MIMNRIADVFFILAILLIFLAFKTTDYALVFNLLPFIVSDSYILLNIVFNKVQVIAFFLFIGAIGKSAQIGLHTWLPDAMEGPTPVSSLLHAATMVTAGVFMIVRCSIIFEYSEFALVLLMLFGGITALFAGLVAVFQFDLKKIIAYSTCSQLGYMFFTCGLSNYNLAFFHLFNHAFFKALLFLSAGSLIHAFMDEQDLRKMGQLRETVPFTLICFLIGSFAIMGIPFLTGFYSKDLILEFAYSRYLVNANFVYFLGIIAAICTSVYSIRIVFLLFSETKKINGFLTIYRNFHTQCGESPWQMFIPMFCLAFGSIFIGYLASDLLMGFGQDFWHESIVILPVHFSPLDTEFIHPLVKNLPVIFSLLFMCLTYFFLYVIQV
jgi:NADH-ubiquinone oxidoreductase chain 5